jgi:uncharacterized FlaG/YvyC family protein
MVNGRSHLGGSAEGFPPNGDVFGPTRHSAAGSAERISRIPTSPPAEVLEALDKAARVLEELASRGLGLHFEYDDATSQLHVQVTNGEGKVVREISPSTLLDIAAGVDPRMTA